VSDLALGARAADFAAPMRASIACSMKRPRPRRRALKFVERSSDG
jgi:hypothetical protein